MEMKTWKYFAEIIILIMGIGMAAAFILGWINGAKYTKLSYPKNQEIIIVNDTDNIGNIGNIGSAKRPLTREAAAEMLIYLIILSAITALLLLISPSQSKENNQPDIENLPKKSR